MLSRNPISPAEGSSDAALVASCLAGDKSAYGRIVSRYQRLLCSVAYSATGDIRESEDIAQEAFVEGWRKLTALREPDKLRSWLCGIVRFKISRRRRKAAREPAYGAQAIEELHHLDSSDEPVGDQTMRQEEQALLWQALERIPDNYREPLVLFYREHQSVERVAAGLELSEDAVKQRLSRGRKMLQEQMMRFVEGALSRSTPGRAFTLGVLATLPELVMPAKAAMAGAAAAQGSMMAKSTGLAALLVSVTGAVNAVLSLQAALDQARTPRERRMVVKVVIYAFFGCLAFLFALYGLRAAAYRWWEHRESLAAIGQGLIFLFIVVWPFLMLCLVRNIGRVRTEERRNHPECFTDPADQIGSPESAYISKLRVFGVPLFHFQFAMPEATTRPAFGWFAAGNRAYGLIFAWGNIAVAPVSVGVVSAGLLTVGALGFGIISLGTVGVGLLAVGCVAVGVDAYAWLSALGWETAQSGGFAIARLAAQGPIAIAEHANDPIARELLADPHAQRNQMIFFVAIVLFSLVPLTAYVQQVRKRFGGRYQKQDAFRAAR